MQNKLLLILIISVFFGCSSDKDIELQNAVNIFDNKNTLPVITNTETKNTILDNVRDTKNIPKFNMSKRIHYILNSKVCTV